MTAQVARVVEGCGSGPLLPASVLIPHLSLIQVVPARHPSHLPNTDTHVSHQPVPLQGAICVVHGYFLIPTELQRRK